MPRNAKAAQRFAALCPVEAAFVRNTLSQFMHFCAGQETVPVGAIAVLRADDRLIVTDRGHGWALASGLDPRAVITQFCFMAEGLKGGRGGSAAVRAPHTRFIAKNSIDGAATTMACDFAIENLAQDNGRVVELTIGNGAMNQGAVREAVAFAAARKPSVVFSVENNGWSELTATSDMCLVDRLARHSAGYGIPSATISGVDPVVVLDSIALAAKHAHEGGGPSLIECKVPQLKGHDNRDIEHYRSKAERAVAEAMDPVLLLFCQITGAGVMTESAVAAMQAEQMHLVEGITKDLMAGSAPDLATVLQHSMALPAAILPNVIKTKPLTYL